MENSKKNAILFDLDGTLWDSVEGVVHAWNEVLEKHPEANASITPDQLRSYMGKTVQQIARLMMPDLPDEQAQAIMDECAEHEHNCLRANGGGKLFDGVMETLKALHEQYDLYIISNCESGYIEIFLDLNDAWPLFAGHTCPGDTGLTKGDNIRLVLQTSGCEKAFYVGDTAGDESATRKAGIPFVYAAYGFGKADSPDAVLHAFSDLPALAEELFDKM